MQSVFFRSKDAGEIDCKALTRAQFDREAAQYDRENRYEMCKEDYPEIMEELLRERVEDVLDCGCGTGLLMGLLSAERPELRLTGIDLSQAMIDAARARLPESVALVQGDCEALPFGDQRFDAIVCAHSFHHYPEAQRFFDNAARVLRPGGRLILRDNTGPALWLWYQNRYRIPNLNRQHGLGDVRYYNRREMAAFAKRAGLMMEKFEERPVHKMHCVMRRPA